MSAAVDSVSKDTAVGSRPLEGIRVIDLSRVLAGPLCGQMLADMGADVIKVEAPTGDENRQWAPMTAAGDSCNFMSVNRGKRGITLNLKLQEGRDVLDKLLQQADVLLHSFLPGTARGLGIDETALRQRHPRLVVSTISAFGAQGDLADRPGYDALLQAFSGIMSITGDRDGGPVRSGVSFVDMTTGILAYCGVLTALMGREKTQAGNTVRVSLLETAVSLLGYHGVGWLEADAMPRREGSGLWHLVPYQAFRCTDGEVLTGALNDGTWKKLCRAVGRPDLENDAGLATNAGRLSRREEVVNAFIGIFGSNTVAHWSARLEAHGVPIAPLHTIDQALMHEQSLANHMVVQVPHRDGHSTRLLGSAFKVGEGANTSSRHPPRLGEHSQEVLSEAGFAQADIDRLRAGGVV
ncbi:CaiB/BaiF CoA transferase family protein [Hydrogenophaga palleronii]|uniref:CaiB/BaiF CoA transferase family protein n=1 Tax=Hydrogenophaga palleronii TaxID=65655 RepID=UPI0008250B35|nr:CoA transferase [Hydrogenophaga palleronii]